MKLFRAIVAATWLSCLSAPGYSEPPPIEIYASAEDISQIVISPDGSTIAFLMNAPEGLFLIVNNLITREPRKLGLSGLKIRYIEWSGPNHILLYLSITRDNWPGSRHRREIYDVYSINIHDGNIVELLYKQRNVRLHQGFASVSAVRWQEDGSVYMVGPRRKDQISSGFSLMQVDGNSGYGVAVAKGSQNTWSWVVTPSGRVAARLDYNQKSNKLSILAAEDRGYLGNLWKPLYREESKIPEIGVVGLNSTEDSLVLVKRFGNDKFGLHSMSLEDGEIHPLFEHPSVDVDGALLDPYTGRVIGVVYTLDSSEQEFFDPRFEKILKAVRQAMPGQRIRLDSWDQAYNRFIVISEGPDNPGTFYLFDVSKSELIRLAQKRPKLAPEQLAPIQTLTYSARDGLAIPAYLTRPPGVEPKNLPLVVFPHGGPEARDRVQFNWWAQALASRGYGVFQMNFRGSAGYGLKFTAAGHGEYGRKMQDDVTDGVRHLIDSGIADPKRVCIVGASYGGYVALAGAAFTPELYRCAVSYAGISDLSVKMDWVINRYGKRSVSYDYWHRFFGTGVGDTKILRELSPARYAEQVKAKVLLIHGKDDTVVDINQSKLMYNALKKADKDVEFIKLDGEDHWLSVEETRIQTLKAIVEFLEQHLAPSGSST